MDTKNKFQPNDRIFAKIPGQPTWPAKVVEKVRSPEASEIYTVYYYGINQDGVLKAEQMEMYTKDSVAKYGKPKRRFNKFKQAMEEIEKDYKIEDDRILLEEAAHVDAHDKTKAAPQAESSPDKTIGNHSDSTATTEKTAARATRSTTKK